MTVASSASPPDRFSSVLIGAMSEETGPLLGLADQVGAERTVGGVSFTPARYGRHWALVVSSGIGLVNAAAATALALTEASPERVWSIGTAGGIGASVRVGQIALGAEYRYSKADARAFGYELGQVPQMPAAYLADAEQIAAARRQCAELGFETAEGLTLSSDVFVTPGEAAAALRDFPQAVSVDMESAAIAQVCHRFSVPFSSIRAISDLCGPDAGGDFDRHLDGAAAVSARLAAKLISVHRAS